MPTRQDQLHSYQFSMQRVVAALVTHDPDPRRSPLRRAGMTALAGLLIATVAVGAAAVYGVLTGAGTANVRDDTVVFLEKGSGARYVYLAADSRLHPVLNYASGLLIANAAAPRLVGTTRKRLAEVPLGAPMGIPDAPDSLPGKADLLTGPWSVCTTLDSGRPLGSVLVGTPVSRSASSSSGLGGPAAAPAPDVRGPAAASASPSPGLLVRVVDGPTFLVYGNRRLLIPADRYTATLRAFRWGDRQAWPVAAAWLNAIPAGPDVVPPRIAGYGQPSAVPSLPIGQLITDGRQWAVALPDGVAAVTELQAALLQTDPRAYDPVTLGGSAFNNLKPSRTHLSDAGDPNGLPTTVPELAGSPQRACMTQPGGVLINPTVPGGTPVTDTEPAPGVVRADAVHVPRGKGALVIAAASPTAPPGSGTITLVTDTGRRYPVATPEALAKLGYGSVTPRPVPAQLVALLPQGPSLDIDRARQTSR